MYGGWLHKCKHYMYWYACKHIKLRASRAKLGSLIPCNSFDNSALERNKLSFTYVYIYKTIKYTIDNFVCTTIRHDWILNNLLLRLGYPFYCTIILAEMVQLGTGCASWEQHRSVALSRCVEKASERCLKRLKTCSKQRCNRVDTIRLETEGNCCKCDWR